ncbi:hypothetical protein [Marivirga sp.]|uniref:hypothetical protein n=1 Tax=Marivirga sp. TaxID=2018662 RepID=UPI003DA71CB6
MRYKKIIIILGSSIIGILTLAMLGVVGFNYNLFKIHSSYLSVKSDFSPIKFNWVNQEIDGYLLEKAALVIPANIIGNEETHFFQFDTGASTSIVYENSLNSLRKKGFYFETVKKGKRKYINKLKLNLGGSYITLSMIEVMPVSKSLKNRDPRNLGSLGIDFIAKKVIEINFKENFIQFYQNNNKLEISESSKFSKYILKGDKIIFPVEINGTTRKLLFDSGCSSFGIITIQELFEDFSTNDSEVSKIKFSTWGRSKKYEIPFFINRANTNTKMNIANQELKIGNVNYIGTFTFLQKLLFTFTRIDGWLGNTPFLNCSLIMDTSKEKFMIIRK